jgi:hypothetical protein
VIVRMARLKKGKKDCAFIAHSLKALFRKDLI